MNSLGRSASKAEMPFVTPHSTMWCLEILCGRRLLLFVVLSTPLSLFPTNQRADERHEAAG